MPGSKLTSLLLRLWHAWVSKLLLHNQRARPRAGRAAEPVLLTEPLVRLQCGEDPSLLLRRHLQAVEPRQSPMSEWRLVSPITQQLLLLRAQSARRPRARLAQDILELEQHQIGRLSYR